MHFVSNFSRTFAATVIKYSTLKHACEDSQMQVLGYLEILIQAAGFAVLVMKALISTQPKRFISSTESWLVITLMMRAKPCPVYSQCSNYNL